MILVDKNMDEHLRVSLYYPTSAILYYDIPVTSESISYPSTNTYPYKYANVCINFTVFVLTETVL